MVITGLTRNQVASRGLEGSNPSVSANQILNRTPKSGLGFFLIQIEILHVKIGIYGYILRCFEGSNGKWRKYA